MNLRTYLLISGIFFLLIGLIHFIRAAAGWVFLIGPFELPLSASWIAFLVALALGLVSLGHMRARTS